MLAVAPLIADAARPARVAALPLVGEAGRAAAPGAVVVVSVWPCAVVPVIAGSGVFTGSGVDDARSAPRWPVRRSRRRWSR